MAKSTQRRKKSKAWAKSHIADNYVKQANAQGYRSRAIYKLQQIDKQYKLLTPHKCIVDLGAAPGSWSQYCANKISNQGQIIAVDLLDIKPIDKVTIIKGDFCDPQTQEKIKAQLNDKKSDLVLSDMSVNLTGISITDQSNMQRLIQELVNQLPNLLKSNGDLLIKTFQGESQHELLQLLKQNFKLIKNIKPQASRPHSKEIYCLARQYTS